MLLTILLILLLLTKSINKNNRILVIEVTQLKAQGQNSKGDKGVKEKAQRSGPRGVKHFVP